MQRKLGAQKRSSNAAKADLDRSQDTRIKRLRAEGATWEAIAGELDRTRWGVIDRGRRIGASLPPADFTPVLDEPGREPLPAGHARTWGALNADTSLANEPYPLPMFRR